MRGMLVVVAIGFIAGCSSGFNRPVHEVTAREDANHVQKVDVTTHTFWFEPNRIVVKAGTPVELHVHNGAWLVPHNFSIHSEEAGLLVNADVRMLGGSKTVRFTPERPGEYHFFCHVDAHGKKHGMTGTLVVTP